MSALLLLGLAIGVDNLIVGTSLGTLHIGARRQLQLAILFGLFEAMLPVAGVLVGQQLASRLAIPWLGQALLGATALLVLLGAHRGSGLAREAGRSPWLLLLPLLLSFDNLLAGSALAALGVATFPAIATIGALSAALAALGLAVGEGLARRMLVPSRLVMGTALLLAAFFDVL